MRLWGPLAGLVAAVAYTYFPYHLADAYIRGAIPEHFAFLWPPLILWAAWRWMTAGEQRDKAAGVAGAAAATKIRIGAVESEQVPSLTRTETCPRSPAPLLLCALAWAGLVYTHNLTALLLAPVFTLFVLVLAAGTRRWRWLLPVAGALLLAVGLSAPLWLPYIVESRTVGLALSGSTGYRNHLAPPNLAIQVLPLYAYRLQHGGVSDHPLSWFSALIVVVGLGLGVAALLRRRALPAGLILSFGLFITVLSVFMLTAASLPVWRLFEPILAQLQYPWRFMALAAIGIMLVAGGLPALLARLTPRPWPAVAAGLVALLCIIVALPGLPSQPLDVPDAEAWAPDRMWREEPAAGQVGATWTGEFLPLTVHEQRWALGRALEGAQDSPAPATPPAVHLDRLGYGQAQLTIESGQPQAIRLHQFWLPGWTATLDGQPLATAPSGELGLVTIQSTPRPPPVGAAFRPDAGPGAGRRPGHAGGAALGGVGLAGLPARAARPGTPRPAAGAAALLLLTVALGLNRTGLGAATWTPHPAKARIEELALLLGYDVAPACGERAVDVTLYWFALRDTGTDYKAFVHLLGPDGLPLAQDDKDPGSGFTPTTRWRAGEIVPDRHRLALPAGLAPGNFALRAGLYQYQPLRNLSIDPPTGDGRIDLGSLRLPLQGQAP